MLLLLVTVTAAWLLLPPLHALLLLRCGSDRAEDIYRIVSSHMNLPVEEVSEGVAVLLEGRQRGRGLRGARDSTGGAGCVCMCV